MDGALALRALRQAGYDTEPFESGEALLAKPEQIMGCDLLLTDVVMPGMDGATLARRALAVRPELPVLFMSGYLDDKLSIFDLNLGRGFLAKPFTPIELQAQVAHILQNLDAPSGAVPPVLGSPFSPARAIAL